MKRSASPKPPATSNLRVKLRRTAAGGVSFDLASYERRDVRRDIAPAEPAPVRRKPTKPKASPKPTPKPVRGQPRKRARRTELAPGRQKLIVFITADPFGGLKLGLECASIQREIKISLHRDELRFESRWAVSITELIRHLSELRPDVIHFGGHGSGGAGIVLHDEQGRPEPVSPRALTMMIKAAASALKLVVLNACWGVENAEALRSVVDCVVCMDGAVRDDAAREFAGRFYGALGNGHSVGNAVEQGIAVLAARDLPDEDLPRILTRDGVDADRVVLVRRRRG
jgi:hypothetical protein